MEKLKSGKHEKLRNLKAETMKSREIENQRNWTAEKLKIGETDIW